MMLPSVLAAEPIKIWFGLGISIPGVANGDLYKASLPKIALTDKGKATLVTTNVVKGHPAREMVDLIFGDIYFLVQLRENVIDEVSAFYHSFSLRWLAVLQSLNKYIAAKEENVLTWVETGSVQVALQRKVYILAKNHKIFISNCWIRLLRHIGDGWVVEDCYDRWVHDVETPVSQPLVQLPQRPYLESLAPVCLFFSPVQCLSASTPLVNTLGWSRVCSEILRYSMFGCLQPVGSVNPCRDLIVKSSVVDILEKVPTSFCDDLEHRKCINNFVEFFSDSAAKPILPCLQEVELVSSDVSSVYRSPSPQSRSSSSNHLDFHISSPTDEEVFATTAVDSTPTVAPFCLPPAVSDSFNDLRTSMSHIISNQSKESRRLDDSHLEVLDKIKHLETTILDAFYQQNQVFHRLITGIHQADARKEAKEQKAIIVDMDERLATLRSEQLDFRAQAQENYNNLSSQLGELVAYMNRGNDKKGEDSSSHQPQPPPDDLNRPSGGNANRGGGGGGSGESGPRDDRKDLQ
ncbi:hypothetical protein F511_15187 [Dorcoceras hygrometricum]|uniref:Uncharacterized protein n=1 Tax=Dorcoceras hygrometricum TaxID=472368 RepID=A0A2Z7CJR0_9LAMI|nr:hypothetical protein F511_15187 [Dorcoceras hygrometricum]